TVPRDFFLLELRSLSVPSRKHPLSPGRRPQERTGAHPEWQGIGCRTNLGCDCRKLSAVRRHRTHSGSAASVYRRRPHHAQEVLAHRSCAYDMTATLNRALVVAPREPPSLVPTRLQ